MTQNDQKTMNLCIKFCNEVTLGVNNGFENNVKSITNFPCIINEDEIIIFPNKNNDMISIHVPKSNVASYWIVE
jgi:hypothetical protein